MDILRLSALGGLLGLDGTAVGQFMVSRPLVAGLLAGWLAGNPAQGVLIGMILELYLLVSVPSGGARFPEASTATVVAVACAAPFEASGALPLAVAGGLVWGQVGGASVNLQRHLNARLVPEDAESGASVRRLSGGHLAAIFLDLVRAAAVTGAGIVTGRVVIGVFLERWPLSQETSVGLLLVGGAVSAGILLNDLGGFRRRKVWFTAGLAVGLLGSRLL
ncbi:MAG: PTS sugar transporter subunit IIC [Longimicrobiales bacterium]|nr:PTS sugar transporter subunit IIC [Longimicrobiales bacterium]